MRKAPYGEWAAAIAVMAVTAALVGHAWGGINEDNAACIRNVATSAQALRTYMEDWDQRFPAMADSPRVRQVITPYLPSGYPQNCPATGQFYVFNSTLQFQTIGVSDDLSATPALRDASPHTDGLSTVAFADGHVERGGVAQYNTGQECQMRARQTTRALLMYVQDYDETLPAMGSASEVAPLLMPYMLVQSHSGHTLECPATGLPFTPNAALSRRSLASISSDFHDVEAFRDPAAHANGVSTIAYLDGHVERDGVEHVPGPDARCDSNLKTLSLALRMYTQDYDEVLPPSMEPVALQITLAPYLHPNISRTLWCPETGLSYRFNPALAGQHEINLSPGVELARDAAPHHNARTTAVRFDGALQDVRAPWTPLALSTVAAADAPGGASRLLWLRADGAIAATLRLSATLDPIGTAAAIPAPAPAGPDLWQGHAYAPTSLVLSTTGRASLLWGGSAWPIPPYTVFEPPMPAVLQSLAPANAALESVRTSPVMEGWKAATLATGLDGVIQQLWVSEDGGTATVTEALPKNASAIARPRVLRIGYGWHVVDLAIGKDGKWKILWQRRDGAAALMDVNPSGLAIGYVVLGPDPGWTAVGVASGAPDSRAWVLWRNRTGLARLHPVAPGPIAQAPVVVPALPDNAIPLGVSVGGDGRLRVWGERPTDGAASVSLLTPGGAVVTSRTLLPPSN